MNEKNTFFLQYGQDYDIISEKDFAEKMRADVVPFLNSRRKSRVFTREADQALYCETFLTPADVPKGTIMISHGFTESCDKYHEVIYYMLREGYHVLIFEHRGHGRSRTPNETNVANTPTHVEHFQDYVNDMSYVVMEVLKKEMPEPYYLFAHSMGGAIGAAFAEARPDIFYKIIFTAPMFEINRHGIPKILAKFIGFWNCLTGKSRDFTVMQKPFSIEPDFDASPCTSEARYMYYFNQQLAHPEYQSAGSSNRWARECLRACDQLLQPVNCRRIRIPVLLFQADDDSFVYPGGQNRFMSQIPDGKSVFVPGSRHEIYMSGDAITARYWRIIFDFLDGKI